MDSFRFWDEYLLDYNGAPHITRMPNHQISETEVDQFD